MNKNSEENADGVSPEAMKNFLQREIESSARAHELRAAELHAIIKSCGNEISVDEAFDRHEKYLERWGQAIPGMDFYDKNMKDAEIIKAVDKLRESEERRDRFRKTNESFRGR